MLSATLMTFTAKKLKLNSHSFLSTMFNIILIIMTIGTLLTEWVTEVSFDKVRSNGETLAAANTLDHIVIEIYDPI
jgi:hypothetical protein